MSEKNIRVLIAKPRFRRPRSRREGNRARRSEMYGMEVIYTACARHPR
jgi:hypothetical protein